MTKRPSKSVVDHRKRAQKAGRYRLAGILSLPASERLARLMDMEGAPFRSRIQAIEAGLIALEKSGPRGAREALLAQMEETAPGD